MSKHLHKFLAIVLGLSVLPGVSAGTVVCEGTIADLVMHQPGLVGLRLSSMNDKMWICRVDADYRAPGTELITPATCKAMYASLLSAKYANATVRAVYFDGDQAPASCSTVQPAAQVSLRYFAL